MSFLHFPLRTPVTFTLLLLVGIPCSLFGAPPRKKARDPARAAYPQTGRVTILTSDGNTFRGTLIDREDPVVTLKTQEGEEIHFPIDELASINGISPGNYLKNFIPTLPEKLFGDFTLTLASGKEFSFRALANWTPAPQTNSTIFTAPAGDPKWDELSFTIAVEMPPKLPAPQTFGAITKRLAESRFTLQGESYATLVDTLTLITAETGAGELLRKSFWQFRQEKGEPYLIQLSLSGKAKERINQPLAKILLEKILKSLKPADPKDKEAAAKTPPAGRTSP